MADIKKRKLTKREAIIYDYLQPKNRRIFVKMSPYKRKRMVNNVIKKLEKQNYDVSEFKEYSGSTQKEVRNRYIAKAVRKTVTKQTTLPIKTAYFVGKSIKNQKKKEVLLDSNGNMTRKKAAKEQYVTGSANKSKEEKKKEKKRRKSNQKKGAKVRNTVGRKVDKALSELATYNQKKSRSTDEIQKEWGEKSIGYATRKTGKAVYKVTKKITMALGKLLIHLISAFVSMLTPLLPVILPIMIIVVVVTTIFSFIFGSAAVEEEREAEQVGSYAVSDTVLKHKDRILEELKKYGKEEYLDLFLAVVMQESGGEGSDIFQCSESLGKEVGTLSIEESINQGVKLLCGYMDDDRVKVSSVDDLEHIRIALQAYNYSGGYIDYINDTSSFGRSVTKEQLENIGKWTQDNALAYQKKRSINHGYPVARTGSDAKAFGPYKYGDAYYTEHVLRYYIIGSSGTVAEVKGISTENRMTYLFPSGLPTDEATARQYMQTISVKIYTPQGNESTMNITVHKSLVNAYKQAFNGMYLLKFPIDASTTAAFNWRQMASDSSKQSYHSYGTCIDINPPNNPATYTSGSYRPGGDSLSITQEIVQIWASAGFYWGGNWDGYYKDYMHFTYTNN